MQVEQLDAKGIFRKAQVSGAREAEQRQTEGKTRSTAQGIVRGSAPETQTVTYGRPEKDQGKAVIEEIKIDAASKDAVQQKNEMVVGS